MGTRRSTGDWSGIARRQAAVAHIGQLGLQGVSLEDLFEEAQRSVADVLQAPVVAMLDWHEDDSRFTVRSAVHESLRVPGSFFEGIHLPGGHDSLPGYTVLRGKAVRSDDLAADDRFTERANAFDSPAGAALVAPVGWGREPVGVLGAWTREPREWSDDDLHFIQSMANTLGFVLFRAAAEFAREESATRLELALQASDLGVFDWAPSRRRIYLGPDAAVLFGLEAARHEIPDALLLDRILPEDLSVLQEDAASALDSTGRFHSRFRVQIGDDAETCWFEAWGQVIGGVAGSEGEGAVLVPGGPFGVGDDAADPIRRTEEATATDPLVRRIVGVVADITAQRFAEEQMERFLAAEQLARHEAERARRRSSVLAEASERFARTLDSTEVLEALADFCVPSSGDVCAVFLTLPDGTKEAITLSHSDEIDHDDLWVIRRTRTRMGSKTTIIDPHAVARTGTGQLIAEVTDEHLRDAAPDDEHLAAHRRLGIRSMLAVPLRARGRGVGSVVLMTCDASGRRLDEEDLFLVQQLADRAALSWDNGRLYESQNRVVRSLQAALLPPALPRIDGLELAARYEVAGSDLEIGGDFYDIIQMGSNDWGLVIGDVCGRGPDAAAVTGLVRHSIRAAVVGRSRPSGVLDQTNGAMLDQLDDGSFCTAAFVRIHFSRGGRIRLTAASAGHPCPIIVRADGRAEQLDCAGTLLGVVGDPELVDLETILKPGDAVILHTDGLTESRQGDEFFGDVRMLETAASLAGRTADQIAEGLIAAVSSFAPRSGDDRAILVARVPDSSRSTR